MEINNKAVLEEMKRFQQIMEYTTVRKGLVDEAGEEEPQEQPQDAPAEGGEMPPMDGGEQAPMPQDGGQDMGGAPMDANQGSATGFNPQVPEDGNMDMNADPNAMPPMDGAEAPIDGGVQPDDDVIDISDLTDSQEETEEKVEKIGDKFDKVMKYLGQFEELIKSNDEKINDLKNELEKRNPTPVEKLSMQTAKSYPFNVTPEEYWKDKTANSNYSIENDENGKGQEQYTITKDDVEGALDWKTISDSLNDFDPYHQTMKNTMSKI